MELFALPSSLLDRPHQTEWLPGRIGVDTPVRASTVQSGGTYIEGDPFRGVHILDGRVEVDLLRVRRIRPTRRLVLLHLLNMTG